MTEDSVPEESIFARALEIESAPERAAFLNRACGNDPSLRANVEALLRVNQRSGDLLDLPEKSTVTFVEPVTEGPGTVIGPYKLLQQIGEGGMGTVYMAEQSHPVQRKVAIKLIKPGLDNRHVIARFEAERQALAVMDHPNIARVFDAGTTEPPFAPALGGGGSRVMGYGRPYFVMELVKGVPITKYSDEHRLTPRQRLELFVPVCQAVQHAHQKGIIHRDLKPSNVLVCTYDAKPVPKVIDFGVAKAAGSKLTERTLFTGFGQVIGTLEYMSPEQAELDQLDVDTRSDIYSLGVLLYELLTGTTPLERKRLREAAFLELLRLIREEETPRPSTRLSTTEGLPSIAANRSTEPHKLSGLLRGELDWIVLKALEKDRKRRYETANGLARDIERYLHDEVVEARPPSTGYRLQKFLRRHKARVLTASLVLLALVVGIIGTTAGLVEARRQKALAIAERDEKEQARLAEADQRQAAQASEKAAQARGAETEAVLDFVENKVFAAARPENQEGGLGRDVKLRQAIEAALPFVDKSFATQPLIEARLRLTLGTSFLSLGDVEIARELFQRARDLYTKCRGSDALETLTATDSLARSYHVQGRDAEALRLREETLAIRKVKLGPEHPATLTNICALASSKGWMGRHAEAVKLYEETIPLLKAKLGPDHPDTLTSMHGLAPIYWYLGRHAQALQLNEETLRRRKETLGPDHPDTLLSMHNLAFNFSGLGRYADAAKLLEETLAVQKRKLGPGHPVTLLTMYNLANAYDGVGQHTDALTLREETLGLWKAKHGADHPETLRTMRRLAGSYANMGRSADALKLLEETLGLWRAKVGPFDAEMLIVMNSLARSYCGLGRCAQAARLAKEAAEKYESLRLQDPENLYYAACCRATLTDALRKSDQSAAVAKQAAAEADRAMALLTQAVARGGLVTSAQLRHDAKLGPLHDRDDFKKLLAQLEAKENGEHNDERKSR